MSEVVDTFTELLPTLVVVTMLSIILGMINGMFKRGLL